MKGHMMASLLNVLPRSELAEATGFAHNRSAQLNELRGRLHFKVIELGPTLYDRQMSDAELRLAS